MLLFLHSRYQDNDLGECDCNNQVMIMNDCTEGFLCLDAAEANGFDGCRRTCKEGEILVPDFSATDGTVSFFTWHQYRYRSLILV